MEMKDLLARMRCPSCGAGELAQGAGVATCAQCCTKLAIDGNNVSAAVGTVLSDEWAEMQAASVERYMDEHYEEDETCAKIFGGFIAVSLKPGDRIFDVGCGLFPSMPAYARDLQHAGYVGLEPLETPVERGYLCLIGAVAEKLPLKDASFEAVVLATSLDHIEHVDQAMAELTRILAPGGRLYFWVGLNEPEAMARAKSFHSIFFGARGARRALRIAAAPAEYAYFMWRMRQRRRRLAKGVPLDHAHFRYYTRVSLLKELADNRLDVRRELVVPGTNTMLVEAVPA